MIAEKIEFWLVRRHCEPADTINFYAAPKAGVAIWIRVLLPLFLNNCWFWRKGQIGTNHVAAKTNTQSLVFFPIIMSPILGFPLSHISDAAKRSLVPVFRLGPTKKAAAFYILTIAGFGRRGKGCQTYWRPKHLWLRISWTMGFYR